jgi:hypothetical protein
LDANDKIEVMATPSFAFTTQTLDPLFDNLPNCYIMPPNQYALRTYDLTKYPTAKNLVNADPAGTPSHVRWPYH